MKPKICFLIILGFFSMAFVSCQKDLNPEYPIDQSDTAENIPNIRLISYNIHGGKGPDGEGTLEQNLAAFTELLNGEHIVCLQEVVPDDWDKIKSLFPAYQYRFYLPQVSTKNIRQKEGGNAILSKLPILDYENKLIQTDPGGDQWERKAQFVEVQVGAQFQILHLFHYHNTYNWHLNDSQSEKEGLEKFMSYIAESIEPGDLVAATGDFNLSNNEARQIIHEPPFASHFSDWVDHVFSTTPLQVHGIYPTVNLNLSDHNAIWAIVCNEECD
jgi:endonuclease/exonuclease/phosphatase family metal-dependent hydrolase